MDSSELGKVSISRLEIWRRQLSDWMNRNHGGGTVKFNKQYLVVKIQDVPEVFWSETTPVGMEDSAKIGTVVESIQSGAVVVTGRHLPELLAREVLENLNDGLKKISKLKTLRDDVELTEDMIKEAHDFVTEVCVKEGK
ncbi:MAG: hypothetical protein IH944_13750 [Armatimonadetes bacterium]|nr:hypothetical protein [Armatimonadota bacterium]